MRELGTVDLVDRAAQWKSKGWGGFDPSCSPLTEDEQAFERQSVPVVQEELVIGKRTLDVGGLRVIKRVSETPVSQMINLRQEKATIERTAVDRPATEADFANFKEGTFEVRETAEEAVIGKSARVVEEVKIGREVTDKSETISDTVRKTDVDVERIPGESSSGSTKYRDWVNGRAGRKSRRVLAHRSPHETVNHNGRHCRGIVLATRLHPGRRQSWWGSANRFQRAPR